MYFNSDTCDFSQTQNWEDGTVSRKIRTDGGGMYVGIFQRFHGA